MIEQIVLTQSFPVISGHDHDCSIKQLPLLELIKQLSEPAVQIGKTIVIRVACQGPRPRGNHPFVDLHPSVDQKHEIGFRLRCRAEPIDAAPRQHIGRMCVDIIQECEERPAGLPPARYPIEEFAIDDSGILPVIRRQ